MKVVSGKWKWCTAACVMAVGVFALSVTLRGAPAEKWSNDARPVSVSGEKAALPSGVLHVQKTPLRANTQSEATPETRVVDGLVAIGPWPTFGEGSVASMVACKSDEACSDCNPCTDDYCADGQCSGGTEAGEPCSDADTNLDCENAGGDCVLFAERTCVHVNVAAGDTRSPCDNGDFCDGYETCDGAGNCDPGTNPCPPTGQPTLTACDEVQGECIAPECTGPGDCNDGLYCTDDTCNSGACVHTAAAACGPDGECTEPIPPATGPQCVEGRCCTGGTCSADNYADCGGATASWVATDDACLAIQPSNNVNGCPVYGAGIAPQGAYQTRVGPVSSLSCDGAFEIGDDYQTKDYPTDLYMQVTLMRFVGQSMSEYSARFSINFYDEFGNTVENIFWPDGQDLDPGDEQVNFVDFDPPLIVPTKGYVAFSVQPNFSPGGRIMLRSTDTWDVGTNDPGKMWLNGGPTTDYLPGPDVLAIELMGTPISAPLGACCDADTAACTDEVPWDCKALGNIFQGIGVPCMVCDTGPNQFEICAQNSDCWACVGGADAGEACTSGATCESGNCSTGALCVMLPACAKQACCYTDGHCEETFAGTCPGDGVEQGYGSNCNLDGQPAGSRNCCQQAYTGGDNCQLVTPHIISVPAVGSDPVSVTISGHNGAATFDDYPDICNIWAPESGERGWWEGFSIDDCANVRIDFCCSDVYGDVVRPAWGNLVSECPCGTLLGNAGVDPPIGIGVGTSGFARGEPFCGEDNLWQTYGPLRAGSYFYPIYTVPDGTTGVPPGGPYQIHVTVGACPVAACCVQDSCQVLNQLECEDLGGYWLAPPYVDTAVVDCAEAPCATGSCCTGPGECTDEVSVGVPMTKSDCLLLPNGSYVGGALCDNPRSPCPICEIQDASNCQLIQAGDYHISMSDYSSPGGAITRADDFVAQGNAITTVCFWGAYLDGSQPAGSFGCSAAVTDDFTFTVYADAGGMPDDQNIMGISKAALLARADFPGTAYEATYGDDSGEGMFAYQATLATPITGLTSGTCYWLEVVNNTAAPPDDPPNYCEWGWAMLEQGVDTNDYSFTGSYLGAPGLGTPVYDFKGERASDLAFCVDCGIATGGCGAETKRTCCSCSDATPPQTCTVETLSECTGGVWDMGETSCTGYICATENPEPPPGDACPDAIVVTGAATPTGVSYNFNSACAETDGPNRVRNENGSLVGFGSEIWYKYVSECTGRLQIGQCPGGSSNDTFDGMIAVFNNPTNPKACLCPGDTGFQQNGNGDDEGCTGIADGGQGYQLRNTGFGDCWMIAAGGFEGAGGPGAVNVKCIAATCTQTNQPAEGPLPSVGFGYRNRYIAFAASSKAGGDRLLNTAIRVKFVDLPTRWDYADGRVMWVQAPTDVSEVAGKSDATPPTFKLAELGCDPYYTDWTQYGTVYVRGQSLVPGTATQPALYDVQAIADDCANLESESSYSAPLAVRMTRWGDIVGGNNAASPQGVVDFTDISAVVDKFKNSVGAPSKTRADVAPIVPDKIVDFTDIPAVVDAFRGVLFPYAGPPVTDPCAK